MVDSSVSESTPLIERQLIEAVGRLEAVSFFLMKLTSF